MTKQSIFLCIQKFVTKKCFSMYYENTHVTTQCVSVCIMRACTWLQRVFFYVLWEHACKVFFHVLWQPHVTTQNVFFSLLWKHACDYTKCFSMYYSSMHMTTQSVFFSMYYESMCVWMDNVILATITYFCDLLV